MFEKLLPLIYVQISPERLTLKNIKTGERISEVPEVAIEYTPKARIVGVGADVQSLRLNTGVKIFNPFSHPRSLVSDFTVGEILLKEFLRKMLRPSAFSLAPRVVMHPLGMPDGGYTQIEDRAFREMSLGAGAAQVSIWHGPELSDAELLSGQFPSTGEVSI